MCKCVIILPTLQIHSPFGLCDYLNSSGIVGSVNFFLDILIIKRGRICLLKQRNPRERCFTGSLIFSQNYIFAQFLYISLILQGANYLEMGRWRWARGGRSAPLCMFMSLKRIKRRERLAQPELTSLKLTVFGDYDERRKLEARRISTKTEKVLDSRLTFKGIVEKLS